MQIVKHTSKGFILLDTDTQLSVKALNIKDLKKHKQKLAELIHNSALTTTL